MLLALQGYDTPLTANGEGGGVRVAGAPGRWLAPLAGGSRRR